MFLGRVSPRRILWLVGQLPADSAFAASTRGGGEHRPWTPELHMLAGIANLLNAANRQRAGKRSAKPIVQPPEARKRKPTVLTVAEIQRRQRRAEEKARATGAAPPHD